MGNRRKRKVTHVSSLLNDLQLHSSFFHLKKISLLYRVVKPELLAALHGLSEEWAVYNNWEMTRSLWLSKSTMRFRVEHRLGWFHCCIPKRPLAQITFSQRRVLQLGQLCKCERSSCMQKGRCLYCGREATFLFSVSWTIRKCQCVRMLTHGTFYFLHPHPLCNSLSLCLHISLEQQWTLVQHVAFWNYLFLSLFFFFINYAIQSQGIHFPLMHIPDLTFILLVCHSWAILRLLQRSIWILSRWRQSRVPSQLFSRFFPALPLDLKVQEESEHVKINFLHSSHGPARHWQWCHSGPPVGLFLSQIIE